MDIAARARDTFLVGVAIAGLVVAGTVIRKPAGFYAEPESLTRPTPEANGLSQHRMFETFEAASTPTRAQSGQLLTLSSNHGAANRLRVLDGRLYDSYEGPGSSLSLLDSPLSGALSAGARFSFGPSDTRGSQLVIAFASSQHEGGKLDQGTGLFLAMSTAQWSVAQMRDDVAVPLATGVFFPNLRSDGTSQLEAQISVLDGQVQVTLPDHLVRTVDVTGARGTRATHVTYQINRPNAQEDGTVFLDAVYAD